MIQDISPHRLDNSFVKDISPGNDDITLYFDGMKTYVRVEGGSFSFPRYSDYAPGTKCRFLFRLDDAPIFLVPRYVTDIPPAGFEPVSLREIRDRDLGPKENVFAAYTAYNLSQWYETSVFCGRCGERNEDSKEERARVCPACGNTLYPRINPAVIVGVVNGDSILLTRYRRGYAHNALIAGFTEIGETLEETVRREVMEEAGIKVKNIRYYKSQPWGIASDILMGFFCDLDGDDNITMDSSELKEARWVKREDIVPQPYDYSLTNEMMKLFKSGADV